MIHHQHEQGSPEWIAARRGVVTGSRFKDCRAKLKNGEPSKDCMAYAYDIARERCGGMAPAKFQNAAMRIGTEQEAPAVRMYEVRTGYLTEEVGFVTTEDGLFGLSPDRLIDDDGVLEVRTLVSSATLFTALTEGDLSEYMDQCLGYLWLLGRQWVDLVLWVPDLQHMTVKRITRDENAIEALEADLIAFAKIVADNEAALRRALGQTQPAPVAPTVPANVAITAAALPETIF